MYRPLRNLAIYLARHFRGDTLKQIGKEFGLNRYSMVSTMVERMKVLIGRDRILKKRVYHLISIIGKSQE